MAEQTTSEPGWRSKRPAPPVVYPDIPERRQVARLSRGPSKECVDIQAILGTGSAGVAQGVRRSVWDPEIFAPGHKSRAEAHPTGRTVSRERLGDWD
jgi:hypothetical protein